MRRFFLAQGWRGEALAALMRLCTYRDALPQGAPTSPCLSNLVNAELDADLTELARRAGARYTRYADDLTFSWSAGDVPAYFESKLGVILRAAGYAVQPCKAWRVWRLAQSPQVTGLVLGADGGVSAPPALRRRVRWLRWLWWWRRDARTAKRIEGYETYLKKCSSQTHQRPSVDGNSRLPHGP